MNSSESFVDEVTISIQAGGGGDGCVAMHREKFVPRGGPSGGDGGRGGDVFVVARRNLSTLSDYRMRREIYAEAGEPGGTSNKTGRNGKPTDIEVPVGTIIHDRQNADEIVADLACDGQRVRVGRSGRGGRGNAAFATSTRQSPDFAERGQPGQIRKLRLSLKLLADVGLIGFPNAGKSTLLRRISAAKPRVAAYPFTTLTPSLGVVEVDDRRFVAADIPGLVEGASDGIGLGHRFLRHVERTQVLVHLIDVGSVLFEDVDPLERYETIRRELAAYNPELAERRELVVLSKVDLVGGSNELDRIETRLRERDLRVLRVSSATGVGIAELIAEMLQTLDAARAAEAAEAAAAAETAETA